MQFLRVLGLVLGSVCFLPCTAAMVGALSVDWPWNERHLAAGAKVPPGLPMPLTAMDGTDRGIAYDQLAYELEQTPGATPSKPWRYNQAIAPIRTFDFPNRRAGHTVTGKGCPRIARGPSPRRPSPPGPLLPPYSRSPRQA